MGPDLTGYDRRNVSELLIEQEDFSEAPPKDWKRLAPGREVCERLMERGVVDEGEREMIHSVFELGDTIAREVMVPRTEIVWIEQTKSIRQALALSLRTGYTRVPVIGESVDDIVGVVTGPRGPEAGVWVIAETRDLSTPFARIVVTDIDDLKGPEIVAGIKKARDMGRSAVLLQVQSSDQKRFVAVQLKKG